VTSPPPDALVARTIRALTWVLLAGCVAAAALGLAAVAALMLTAPTGADLGPVTTLLAVGQLAALATAAVGGLGLWRTLRPREAGQAAGPGAADWDDVAGTTAVRTVTARRLALLARVTAAGCVLAVAVWSLTTPGGALGSLLGAAVAAQVAVLDVVLSRRLSDPGAARD
jgi:hypothetical protein